MNGGKAVGNSIKLLLLLVLFTVCCRAAFFDHTLTFTKHSSHKSAFLSVVSCLIVLCSAIMWATLQCPCALEYKTGVASHLAAIFDVLRVSRCCSVLSHTVILCYTATVKKSYMYCPVIDCHIKNMSFCR
jgi:hypothetical protein